MMDVKFNPSGSIIAITGENVLRYLHTNDLGHFLLNFEPLKGNTATSVVSWITDNIISCGFMDGTILVGDFKTRQVSHRLKSAEMIKQLSFKDNNLVFMDVDGRVGLWETDFQPEGPTIDSANKNMEKLDLEPEVSPEEMKEIVQEDTGVAQEPVVEEKPKDVEMTMEEPRPQ